MPFALTSFRLLALVVALLASMADAYALDRRDWIKGLKQPGTGNSCCDISDCMRTVAEWRRDGWWAQVWGRWTPVPGDKLLTHERSYDGSAYVCASWSSGILCFVPPNMPM